MSAPHHAYVIDGEFVGALARAKEYVVNTLELTIETNPDVAVLTFDRFGVDDARTLKQRASQTPLGSRQVFVISANLVTREAQNGLLKLLEEPAPNTYFVLVVPSIEQLLPTVRSRVQHLETVRTGEGESSIDVQAFYTASLAERLRMLSVLVEKKDRGDARKFLDQLESFLHDQTVPINYHHLHEVAFVRSYLGDTSSSLKMLLEHVAVTLVQREGV